MDNLVTSSIIILQARMGSERLPGKVMLNIQDEPMIGYQLERLKQSTLPIILATSTNTENDILCEYAINQGIDIYRGDETNVLLRYYEAAKTFKIKNILRITGDNPLIDGRLILNILRNIKEYTARTYVSTGKSKTYPIGSSFEMFSFELLEEAHFCAKSTAEKEHVTPYLHQNMPGDVKVLAISAGRNDSDIRLTVDTQEDFNLIKELIVKFQCHEKSLEEVIEIYRANPYLSTINEKIIQKDWDE